MNQFEIEPLLYYHMFLSAHRSKKKEANQGHFYTIPGAGAREGFPANSLSRY